MSKHVLIVHGPNLNLLGTREPHIYGTLSQSELLSIVTQFAAQYDIELELFQSNHEGAMIDALHSASQRFDGIICNPSALTHTSIALRDAVGAIELPVIEVHLSNVHDREPYRKTSYIAERAAASISGAGVDGYFAAVLLLARRFESLSAEAAA